MKIIDLTEEHEPLYFVCLEDWSEEMKEAANHKELWYRAIREKGLRVKLALDDSGRVGGMIEYLPIEHSFAEGSGLYFINCIWVHGHRKGRGNFQKKGMGQALLRAAEEDVRARGAKGLVAWGISLPFWMRASWFKKHGYQKVDADKGLVLLWKPFVQDANPPGWMKQGPSPELIPGKVRITSFLNGQCPAMNLVHERARRAALEFANHVEFQTICTRSKEVMMTYGQKDALYINSLRLRPGPPISYKRIRSKIRRQVKKIESWVSMGVIAI